MSLRLSLRHGLLAVAALALLSCTVSIAALVRLSSGQRIERAREHMAQELDITAAQSVERPPVSIVGLRSGVVATDETPVAIDARTDAALAATLSEEAKTHATVINIATFDDVTLLTGARPVAKGEGVAWTTYAVAQSTFIRTWSLMILVIVVTTGLLVGIALAAVSSVRKGAESIGASLTALAKDLQAPVPRPALRELADAARGVEELARELGRSQDAQKRLADELAAQERLAALGRVVAGVAHEVRNPLAAIKLRLDLAVTQSGIDAETARELTVASEEISRLDRLVRDLLVVSGRRVGPRADVDLGAFCRERASLLRGWAAERGVTVDVHGSAYALIDRDALARAVDNLVRNAVEASPEGATVAIEVELRSGAAALTVADAGAGVDPSRAGELFEPFFTTKPDGTGLGLALSRAVAQAHGGTLEYERVDGESRFTLVLPRVAERLEAAE